MTFTDIPKGADVFLDANTFIYHFTPHPTLQASCQDLLERIARGEIAGYTTPDVLSDVAHRLMTYEAADKFGWPMAGIAYRLKKQPAAVQSLDKFRQSVEEVQNFGVQFVTTDMALVLTAAEYSQQHGLLSRDALIVAVMQANNLTALASHDDDFDRVPGITRYAPA